MSSLSSRTHCSPRSKTTTGIFLSSLTDLTLCLAAKVLIPPLRPNVVRRPFGATQRKTKKSSVRQRACACSVSAPRPLPRQAHKQQCIRNHPSPLPRSTTLLFHSLYVFTVHSRPRDVIREGDTDDHTVRRARETGGAKAFDANNDRGFLARTQRLHEESPPPPRPRPHNRPDVQPCRPVVTAPSDTRPLISRRHVSSSPEREGEEMSSREITSRPRKRPRRAISPEREGVAHPLTHLQTPLSPSPRRPHSQSPRPRPRQDTPSESSDSDSQPDGGAERPRKKTLPVWACCEPKCACVCHGLRLGVAPWLPVDS
ncbi:hypothetical protein B0H11DRAFT_35927 [Mycena galericulata]|nr:hypothetical protein B0H11DRAFT_35927 [Mycena galericulata]